MLPRILRASLRNPRVKIQHTRNIRPNALGLHKRFYAEEAKSVATSVILTLATPNAVFIQEQAVDAVILPGLEGEFEVDPNLVPIISELRPGVVTVLKKGGERSRYFISAGFAFVHADSSCNVNPVECVSIEDLDPDAARAALAEAQQKFAAASTEQEKAMAQISAETAEAVLRSISK
jgi:F-type H+-transporting ATPase subunit delta